MKSCHSCGQEWIERENPGFSAACEKCGEYLHCCLNCRFHSPGSHGDCLENQADLVRDKSVRNMCEWFQFREQQDPLAQQSRSREARAKLEELFGGPGPDSKT